MRWLQIVCLALMLTIPSVARADWQYTRWGMSREAVVSASQGRAVSRGGELVAPFESGDYRFEATFQFKDDKLWSVDLSGVRGSDCYRLTGDLKAKYGPPTEYYPANETYWWRDRPNNNHIMVTTMVGMNCVVHYEALSSGNNSNL